MSVRILLSLYAAAVVAASLGGGWLPTRLRLNHARMQMLMSFVAGLMLGVGLLHMLPHAAAELGSFDRAVTWMLAGLLVTFLLQRFLHFHQHEVDADEDCPGHGLAHDDPSHAPARTAAEVPFTSRRLGWLAIALGLTLHSLMDGVALAASVEAESNYARAAGLFGVGTFLAVLLHKPLDAMSITMMLIAGGWSRSWQLAVNALFALVAPAGMAAFVLGIGRAAEPGLVLGCALAFSAGVFLCISLCDLLPELQFHAHHRIGLSGALMLGIALSYLINLTEVSGHFHSPAGHHHAADAAGAAHEHASDHVHLGEH